MRGRSNQTHRFGCKSEASLNNKRQSVAFETLAGMNQNVLSPGLLGDLCSDCRLKHTVTDESRLWNSAVKQSEAPLIEVTAYNLDSSFPISRDLLRIEETYLRSLWRNAFVGHFSYSSLGCKTAS